MNIVDGRYVINEPYVDEIIKHGGIPLCFATFDEKLVEKIDGLLLTGGFDIDPKYFGEQPHPMLGLVTEKRDEDEMQLVKSCLEKNIPILGICRGIQMINVYFGGNLYQHIDAQFKTTIQHQQKGERSKATHMVVVEKDSKLFSILEKESFSVNSLHHQGIRFVGKGLKPVAKAEDGLIEAVELEEYPFCIAVQWHPEELAKVGDIPSLKLFRAFIESAKNYLLARKFR